MGGGGGGRASLRTFDEGVPPGSLDPGPISYQNI